MTNRFYLISTLKNEPPVALVESSSKQRAMLYYAECFNSVRVANARDVAKAFQDGLLILSAPEETTEEDTKGEENVQA